jgi:hypothetical protein
MHMEDRISQGLARCTDIELYRLITMGDRDALVAAFDRYGEVLYGYIVQVAGTRIRGTQLQEDTKEILIDIFQSLWASRQLLPETLCLSDYLLSSAYHRSQDCINKNIPR